jgi:hypothetical protein
MAGGKIGGNISQGGPCICRANRIRQRVLGKATSWLGLRFRGTRRKNRRAERNTCRKEPRPLEVNCGSVKRRKNGKGRISAADRIRARADSWRTVKRRGDALGEQRIPVGYVGHAGDQLPSFLPAVTVPAPWWAAGSPRCRVQCAVLRQWSHR